MERRCPKIIKYFDKLNKLIGCGIKENFGRIGPFIQWKID